ncbi:hypothetical protein [Pseudomonas sp. OTU5201]|uniref:hypothetical protein n=1 Tax=Pseudomonas sp. OTU5201 TaxID=3043850 RepID=UPI00313B782B
MYELSVQVAQEDRDLLAALRRTVGQRVPAIEHCRELPLMGWHWKHRLDVLVGMEAAELSLPECASASPWAALAEGRRQRRGGWAREAFELGFLMRMHQRAMAAGIAP